MNKTRILILFSIPILVFSFNCISISYCSENTSIPECNLALKLSSPEPRPSGYFGSSCVMINETIIIGEPAQHSDSSNTGTVWFFNLEGTMTMFLKSPIKANASSFGYAITSSEKYLIISDPGRNVDGVKSAGMIHFYTRNGDYLKSIHSHEPLENGQFGRSLACNGDLIIVGEPGPQIYDENITSRVQVYDNSGSYLYTLQQSDARTGSFGMSIAANNDTIIVGEPYYSESIPSWQGIIYMYNLNGSLIRNITSPFHMTSSRPRNFGFRISASDNIFSVGEVRGNVDEHEFAGRAYIYDRNGDLLANLTSLQSPPGIHYGYSLVKDDLILVEDYVRIENFTSRLAAIIYDKFGVIQAVVPSRVSEYVKGYPLVFTEDYVVLGDVLGASDGVQYAGNVFVCSIPEDVWKNETSLEKEPSIQPIIVVGGIIVMIIIRKSEKT